MLFFYLFLISSKDFIFFTKLFFFDSFSNLMVCIIPLALLMVWNMKYSALSSKDNFICLSLFLILCLFNFLCYTSNSPIMFLMFMEFTVIPMAFLVIFLSKDYDKIHSVYFMSIMNIFGSFPFMLFLISHFKEICSSYFILQPFCYIYFSSFLMFMCFSTLLLGKLPIFAFHFWLTKAHVSAAGSCSMILASLMLKLGSFGLLKYVNMFSLFTPNMIHYVFSFSLTSMLLFCFLMIRFFDVKNLIACSSIVHMAIIFPGTTTNSSISVMGSLTMMVGHGIISYALFFLVTIIYEGSFNLTADFNKSMGSISKTMSMFLFIWIVLNIGFPPLMSFLSEFFFLLTIMSYSYIALIIYLFCSFIIMIFFFYLLTKLLFGKKDSFISVPGSVSLYMNMLFYLMALFFLMYI